MPGQDEQEPGMFSGIAAPNNLPQHRPYCLQNGFFSLQSENTYNEFWDPKYKEYNIIKNLHTIEITDILNIKNN